MVMEKNRRRNLVFFRTEIRKLHDGIYQGKAGLKIPKKYKVRTAYHQAGRGDLGKEDQLDQQAKDDGTKGEDRELEDCDV